MLHLKCRSLPLKTQLVLMPPLSLKGGGVGWNGEGKRGVGDRGVEVSLLLLLLHSGTSFLLARAKVKKALPHNKWTIW